MRSCFFVSLVIGFLALISSAQTEPIIVAANANACELNSLHLDVIRTELANKPGTSIVAKVFGGKHEPDFVIKKRAEYVRKFLERHKGFSPTLLRFVIAGRLRTEENPKIEIYLTNRDEKGHEPYLVIYSQPNKTPCLECCGNDAFSPRDLRKKLITQRKL